MKELIEKHKPYLKILVIIYKSYDKIAGFRLILNKKNYDLKDFKYTQKAETKVERFNVSELFSRALDLIVSVCDNFCG